MHYENETNVKYQHHKHKFKNENAIITSVLDEGNIPNEANVKKHGRLEVDLGKNIIELTTLLTKAATGVPPSSTLSGRCI